MRICVVTDAHNPHKNENRKMDWSDHLECLYEKMVQINTNTNQAENAENKKCVLSALIIWPKNELS